MNLRDLGAVALIGLTTVACGGSDDEAATQADVNEDQAKASAQQTAAAVNAALVNNDGQGAANQLQAAASTSQGVVTPAPMGGGSMYQAGTAAGTCECDEAAQSCTFTDCGPDGGNSTMSGTISWADGKMLCDLTFVVNQVVTLEMNTTCDLTVSETEIDGTLTSSGAATGLQVEGAEGQADGAYSWSVDTTFNAVTHNGGTPTGGSMDVSATYDIGGQTYAGSATVELP